MVVAATIDRHKSAPASDAGAFEQHRPALLGLAYRLLGEVAAAEDAVQETWIRWHRTDRSSIGRPRAWLLSVCARLCIDELRSARARRESYVGPWLPEPLWEPDQPTDPVERSEQVSIAFLLLLQELRPADRAAYVLREVFGIGYEEIAGSLGKTAAACRQMVSRATRRIGATALPARADRAVTGRFAAALAQGDTVALTRMLTEDAVLLSDGGGKAVSALNPIHGADRIARFFLGIARKRRGALEMRPAILNAAPAFILRHEGRLFGTIGFAARGGRICAVYVTRNPDKLMRLGGVLNDDGF